MHEIYTLITHAGLMFISTYYFQIFIYWFISILILLIRSGYIIVSFYYSVSSYIFRARLHEVIQIPIFTGYQLKRPQTKQVVKSHILCNYVSKENSNEAFPNLRCCSISYFFCFNKKKFVKEAFAHGLYAPTTMQCLA